MFSSENKRLVLNAIANEYMNITKTHGEVYNSKHEGYAVLLEEVEEATDELHAIENEMLDLWLKVKNDNYKSELMQNLTEIIEKAVNVALESVQVAAVATRFNLTLEKN